MHSEVLYGGTRANEQVLDRLVLTPQDVRPYWNYPPVALVSEFIPDMVLNSRRVRWVMGQTGLDFPKIHLLTF